jgi:spore germination cell wall hydrolase CwlJ-like protein
MNKQRKIVFAGFIILALMMLTMLNNTMTSKSVLADKKNSGFKLISTNAQIKELELAYEDLLIEEEIQAEEDNNKYLINNDINEGVKVVVQKVKKKKKKKNAYENRWNITLSKDENELLARIVFQESRGESDLGQRAVCEVVFNRMKHDAYGGSLYEILSSPSQFSSWSARNSDNPTDKEYKNIKKVLNGESEILSKDYVYFSTSPRNNNGTIQIGNHYFCKY